VVTGASAGIGRATARTLAAAGWRVIGVGRDPARAAEAEAEIRAVARAPFDMLRADLSLVSETKRVAADIAERVDVLFNNAGGVRDRRIVTSEGNEATFAANHLAPFILTERLLPQLRAAARTGEPGATRILAVSSTGHEYCKGTDWADLQMLRGAFTPGAAYCQAKLANILFTRELARRLAPEGIVAQAMHPGVVDSNFGAHGDAAMQAHMKSLSGAPPEEPAETLFWMATAAEAGAPGGRYFHQKAELLPSPVARDDDLARRLWTETERIAAAIPHRPDLL
ncbi:MAG: SDR family NAD(P)-dependent oxidoreductase, partial [Parvularculaceae bacterium]|nr:SDR family NAD(P)-dependent oxidoreductase [Parvularculaceae bacterium]